MLGYIIKSIIPIILFIISSPYYTLECHGSAEDADVVKLFADIYQGLVLGVLCVEYELVLVWVIINSLEGSFVLDDYGCNLAVIYHICLLYENDISVVDPGAGHRVAVAGKAEVSAYIFIG